MGNKKEELMGVELKRIMRMDIKKGDKIKKWR
jgi:hypothetical protein